MSSNRNLQFTKKARATVPGGNSRDIFYLTGTGFCRQEVAVSGIMEAENRWLYELKMGRKKGLFRGRKKAGKWADSY